MTGNASAALIAGGFQVNEQNLFTMSAVLNNPADFPNGAADYIDPTDTTQVRSSRSMGRMILAADRCSTLICPSQSPADCNH